MEKAGILPQLSTQDVLAVIGVRPHSPKWHSSTPICSSTPSLFEQLIQHAYAPTGPNGGPLSSEEQKRIQQELMDVQKRDEAWGLVIPLLDHEDGNVQFFGGHTAQIKIARDW